MQLNFSAPALSVEVIKNTKPSSKSLSEHIFHSVMKGLGRPVIDTSKKRTGISKATYFEAVFPYRLLSNEWKAKWPVDGCKWSTYTPDYYCPALRCYVECCTSWPNYSEARPQWMFSLKKRMPLRVFWWEGQEITLNVYNNQTASVLKEMMWPTDPTGDK